MRRDASGDGAEVGHETQNALWLMEFQRSRILSAACFLFGFFLFSLLWLQHIREAAGPSGICGSIARCEASKRYLRNGSVRKRRRLSLAPNANTHTKKNYTATQIRHP